MNQYKYADVPLTASQMANLTGHELAEAIRMYKDRMARNREKDENAEDSEDSGNTR